QHLVFLPGEDARQRDAPTGRDPRGQRCRQRHQRRGQDVGNHHRVGGNRLVFGQVHGEAVADVVAGGVVGGGGQRRRIVVGADRGARAQLERGQGEDAGSAAEIEDGGIVQRTIAGKPVEPLQAQRGGRVGARA